MGMKNAKSYQQNGIVNLLFAVLHSVVVAMQKHLKRFRFKAGMKDVDLCGW